MFLVFFCARKERGGERKKELDVVAFGWDEEICESSTLIFLLNFFLG